jgi:hypothetical protein
MEVLQTSALPLGYGADENLGCGSAGPPCTEPKGPEPENSGAGNGIRTRDFDLGKVALYH